MVQAMINDYKYSLRIERKQAIQAAHDLCYGHEIVQRIIQAESASEIWRILKEARLKSSDI